MIENDVFVRAAWQATPEPQVARVYAIRVEMDDGDVEYVNARAAEPDAEHVAGVRAQYTRAKKPLRVVDASVVWRDVSISGTDWGVSPQ